MKKHIIYISIIVVLFLLCFNQCSLRRQNQNRYESNYAAQLDSTNYYRNKIGEIVSTKMSLSLTKDELKRAAEVNERLKESLKGFKKTIAVLQTTQSVKYDTVYVPFEKPIDCTFSKTINYDDDILSFSQVITNNGFTTPKINLKPNNQDIVFGWKKKAIFKKPTLTAEITNSNKAYTNHDLKPIVILYDRSWYEKPIYTIPIGFLFGVVLSK